MKIKLLMIYLLILSLCQMDLQAKSYYCHKHHCCHRCPSHKHKSSRKAKKKQEKLAKEKANALNKIQQTLKPSTVIENVTPIQQKLVVLDKPQDLTQPSAIVDSKPSDDLIVTPVEEIAVALPLPTDTHSSQDVSKPIVTVDPDPKPTLDVIAQPVQEIAVTPPASIDVHPIAIHDSKLENVTPVTEKPAVAVEPQNMIKSIMASDIGPTGYVIDQPGVYILDEDVVFNPADPCTFNPIIITDSQGVGAQALGAFSDGVLRSIFVLNGGSGYIDPKVTITGPGVGATATATLSSGSIIGFTVLNGGSQYTNTVQAAITILSPNVTLKLNGHRLSQFGVDSRGNVSSQQIPFVIGIFIPDIIPFDPEINHVGLSSIYIDGDQAVIDGFSMFGGYVQGHTADIRISNFTIKNCGQLASLASRTANPALAYYVPHGVPLAPGFAPFAVGGLSVGESDILGMGSLFFTQNEGSGSVGIAQNRVNAFVLENVSCTNNFFIGMNMANSTNVAITDAHFDGAYSDDPALPAKGAAFGLASVDYEYPSLMNLSVKNSTFNQTSMGLGDFERRLENGNAPIGCWISHSRDLVFMNSHFDHTVCHFTGDGNSGAPAGCFNVTTENATYENCSFSGTVGLGGNDTVIGFIALSLDYYNQHRMSHGLKLINCEATNIQQIGDQQKPMPILAKDNYQAVGFLISNTTDVVLEGLHVADVIANGPMNAGGSVAGIMIRQTKPFPIPEGKEEANIVLQNCTIQRSTTVQGGSAVGMAIEADNSISEWGVLRSITLVDCVVEGSQSLIPTLTEAPYNAVQGTGIGFVNFVGTPKGVCGLITYNRCEASNNKGVPTISGMGELSYSAGFVSISTVSGTPITNAFYSDCKSTDNVYGFMLANSKQMGVKGCVADSTIPGGGFVDLGISVTFPGTASTNLLQDNTDTSIDITVN